MEDQIISWETAKLAKEKGFNIPIRQEKQVYDLTTGIIDIRVVSNQIKNWNDPKYIDIVSAPTQSLLQRWLREVHQIHIFVYMDEILWDTFRFNILMDQNMVYNERLKVFDTYEEALENGLYESLKLIKQ